MSLIGNVPEFGRMAASFITAPLVCFYSFVNSYYITVHYIYTRSAKICILCIHRYLLKCVYIFGTSCIYTQHSFESETRADGSVTGLPVTRISRSLLLEGASNSADFITVFKRV
jgi:hypothetical protein